MAKIFIAFFNGLLKEDDPSVMPCFYESLLQELKIQGNSLLVRHHKFWNKDFGPIPLEVKEEICKFSPDFALIFNNSFFDLSEDFDFPIYIYEVDSPIYYANKDTLKSKNDRFKYIVSQDISIKAICESFGVSRKNIIHVPFVTSVQREDKTKEINISFIGTRFGIGGPSLWGEFIRSAPSQEALAHYKAAIDYLVQNPFCSNQELIDKFGSNEFNAQRFLKKDDMISAISGRSRMLTLSSVADLGLTIFGTKSWIDYNCEDYNIPFSFNSMNVYSLKHNQDIYNSSKLSININHVQAVEGFSWRVCDIMASGACLVSEYKPDFEKRFPKIPIPLFNNRFEARELCKKMLSSYAMREDIVAQCNEVIDKKFRFTHLFALLEDFMNISLCKNVPTEVSTLDIAVFPPPHTPPPPRPTTSTRKIHTTQKNTARYPKSSILKKRSKLFGYALFLAFAQLPIFSFFLKKETILKKINKYGM